MIKRISLITFLLFILVGCVDKSILNTPENLRFEDGFLKWSEVDNAEHYVLDFYGETKLAYNHTFDLKNYPTGNYTVRIASFSNGKLSSYSEPISFQLIQNEVIDIIDINEEQISWMIHSGLDYQINVINPENQSIIKTENTDLNRFIYNTLEDGLYDIEIIALLGETEVTSKTIRVLKGDYIYVKDVGIILDLEGPTDIYFEDTKLESGIDYEIDEYGLILDAEAINVLAETFDGVLITLKYDVDVYMYVSLITIEKPIMVSSNTTTYKGSDVTFEFDLKGGIFESLSGIDLEETDYTFIDNILTIKASYIEKMIQKYPDSHTIFLTYFMSNSPHVVFGFISIKII